MDDSKPNNKPKILQINKIILSMHVILNMPYYFLYVIAVMFGSSYGSLEVDNCYLFIVLSHWLFELLSLVIFAKSFVTKRIKLFKIGLSLLIVHVLLFIPSTNYLVDTLGSMSRAGVTAFGFMSYSAILILWDVITLPLVIIIAFKIRKYILLKQVKPENT